MMQYKRIAYVLPIMLFGILLMIATQYVSPLSGQQTTSFEPTHTKIDAIKTLEEQQYLDIFIATITASALTSIAEPTKTPSPIPTQHFQLRVYSEQPKLLQVDNLISDDLVSTLECFPEHTEFANYKNSEEIYFLDRSFLSDSLVDYPEFILNATDAERIKTETDRHGVDAILKDVHTMFRKEAPQRPGVYSQPIPPPHYLIEFVQTHNAAVGAASLQSTTAPVHVHGIFFLHEPVITDEHGRSENLYTPLDDVVEEFRTTFLDLFKPLHSSTSKYPERTIYFNENCLAVLDEAGSNQFRGFYYWALAPLNKGSIDVSDHWQVINAMLHSMQPEE